MHFLAGRVEDMAQELRELVELESPSSDKAAVDRLASRLADKLEALGLDVQTVPVRERGNHVRAALGGGDRQVLVLCHMDTVWPVGEVERRPVRVVQGRLYGPGAYDMKAGIVQTLWALRALAHLDRAPGVAGASAAGGGPGHAGAGAGPAGGGAGPAGAGGGPVGGGPGTLGSGSGPAGGGRGPGLPDKRVVFLYTSDEEVGSQASRALIEEEARRSQAVLVLEPAGRQGGAKLWRKGVADFRVRVEGRAAHAGADPERGVSAILELCRQVLDIYALANPGEGTTVNVGVIRGGTRPNVVAAEAEAEVDFRAITSAEMDRIVAGMAALRPHTEGAVVTVTGGVNRPPMERTPASERLYHLARDLAQGLGFDLPAEGTGGASDGNFTAHLGIPTLDGLGAVGNGAHAVDEHVVLEDLPRRTALLVRLLQEL